MDDPLAVLKGTEAEVDRKAARLIMLWLALGYDLSWHKGQFAAEVDWVGYQLQPNASHVTASINEEFMDNLLELTREINSLNIIPRKTMQTVAGKCSHVANMLFAWRPFLDPLWASLLSNKPTRAFKGGHLEEAG